MDESDKDKSTNLISLDEKTLTAIQLLKDVRKEIAQYRKKDLDNSLSSSSNAVEINAYKAVEEVLPRMVITPMLSAQIERHRDKVAFSLKETELMKEISEVKAENINLKEEIAVVNTENKKLKAELIDVQYIIKGLALDKVPEGISPSFRQLIEAKARRIVQLEGTIKEITKEKEAMKKELAEVKSLLNQSKKTPENNYLQGKELMEFEALLDEPDQLIDDPLVITSSPSVERCFAPTRKRIRQDHSDHQQTIIHEEDMAKKGFIELTTMEKEA